MAEKYRTFTLKATVDSRRGQELKLQYEHLLPKDKRSVLNGLISPLRGICTGDNGKMVEDLRAEGVTPFILYKWFFNAQIKSAEKSRVETKPFKIELKGKEIVTTTHEELPKKETDKLDAVKVGEEEEDASPDLEIPAVINHALGHEINAGPLDPKKYITDRVIHHIDHSKKKAYSPVRGTNGMSNGWVSMVSTLYEELSKPTEDEMEAISSMPVETRNSIMKAYHTATPRDLRGQYLTGKSGATMAVPVRMLKRGKKLPPESMLKVYPALMSALGGSSSGAGYYAQFHVDGNASIVGSDRTLVDFVTDFHPHPDIMLYYVETTDARKAYGVYYRLLVERKYAMTMVVYRSNSIDVKKEKDHLKGETIIKSGVLGMPYTRFLRLFEDYETGYYAQMSVSNRTGKETVKYNAASEMDDIEEKNVAHAHVQRTVSIPNMIHLMTVKKENNFRMSCQVRKGYVMYDNSVKVKFEEIYHQIYWGLLHAARYRFLTGPLLADPSCGIELSPIYKFFGPDGVKVVIPCASKELLAVAQQMMDELPVEYARRVTIQREFEEEEEEVVPLLKSSSSSKSLTEEPDMTGFSF